jgi:3-phenylpropionate/trans-cinnamate dioxygenase ferredoxin reductase subunit
MSTGPLARRGAGRPGLVVVGAGIAGLRVVQSVRAEGFDGSVTMVGAEPHLPYDRPPLSKQVLKGELSLDATSYHPAAYYADQLRADLVLGSPAVALDLHRRRVTLHDGTQVPYSAVVVATGSRPRRLPFSTPQGVLELRTRDDAVAIRRELHRVSRLAVVGAGFIGAEIASTARSLGLEVDVVETAVAPLARAVGPSAGRLLAGLHDAHGARLRCGKAVTGFRGVDRVDGLHLDDGSVLATELVVVGVGVTPDVEWLAGSGLPLGDGLECDEFLHAGHGEVFGAGDVVSWPNERLGRRARSQQWTTAADQGRHVGRVLVRGPEEAGRFGHDMYFWSDQYGVRIQAAGDLAGESVVLERGEATTSRLVVGFRTRDRLGGVLGVNAPRQFKQLRAAAREGVPWQDAVTALTGPAGQQGPARIDGGDAA